MSVAPDDVQQPRTILKGSRRHNAQGQDPGPIDGVMGAKTQDAIKAFQSSQNLTATGQIDQQTIDKLGVGRTSARQ